MFPLIPSFGVGGDGGAAAAAAAVTPPPHINLSILKSILYPEASFTKVVPSPTRHQLLLGIQLGGFRRVSQSRSLS